MCATRTSSPTWRARRGASFLIAGSNGTSAASPSMKPSGRCTRRARPRSAGPSTAVRSGAGTRMSHFFGRRCGVMRWDLLVVPAYSPPALRWPRLSPTRVPNQRFGIRNTLELMTPTASTPRSSPVLMPTTGAWYPTVRLFRQDATRTWDSAIARIQVALRDYA